MSAASLPPFFHRIRDVLGIVVQFVAQSLINRKVQGFVISAETINRLEMFG